MEAGWGGDKLWWGKVALKVGYGGGSEAGAGSGYKKN